MEFYVDEKQKRKNRRLLKIKIYVWFTALSLLLVGIFYTVVYSSVFRITKIDVDVNTDLYKPNLTEDLKIFFAGRSKIAKFLGADNILIWNNKTDDFLKKNFQIISLSVKKNYFRREIKIGFQKRERFGVWCGQNEICFWFDKNGATFERAPKIEGEMIYKVNDFSERVLAVGNKVIEERLFVNLLKIFNILEKNNLGVRTLQIKDLSLQEAIVEPKNILMPKIYFSLRFDPSFAEPSIQEIKEYGFDKIEYIDFRVENRAYYKPR